MIEFYGGPMSSSGRTRWMLEETGVSYEYKRIDVRSGQTKSPEYLRVYPGGKIPALRDGDTVSFWSLTNLQPDLLTVMFDGMKPPEKRDGSAVEAAKTRIEPLLGYLEQTLSGREYLVGNRFTVADVNAGSVVNLARAVALLATRPGVSAWMERLAARPAYQRASKD